MARWRKILEQMLTDDKPVSYTYGDASAVLAALGFEVASHSGGSHRKWRLKSPSGNVVVIGLVEHGSGPLKPYLIRDMIQQLRSNGLIPADMESK